MATGKRFYWMKLKESFMTSDTIDYFMSQPDGANYVVLYQMLCLKTINTDGRLSRQIGEVVIKYDIPKIQRDLKWFSADTIRVRSISTNPLALSTRTSTVFLFSQITTILLGARQTGAKRSAGSVIPRRSKVGTMSPLMSPQLSP